MAIKRQKLIHLHGAAQLTNTGALSLGEIAVRHATTKVDTELAVKTEIGEEDVLVYFPSLDKVESTIKAAIDTLGDGQIANIQGQIDEIADTVGIKVGEGAPTGLYKEIADVLGTTGDASTANTVYGAKKYAEEKAAAAKTAAEGTAKGYADAAQEAAEGYTDTKIGTLPSGITTVVDAINAAQAAAEDAAEGYTDTKIGTLPLGITTVVGAIDAAQAAAEKTATDFNTEMDARVDALEAIDHDHTNKTVLDGITANKVAAWDAAENNAKAAVIGTTGDAATANTVYGAKKYADGKAKEWSDTVLGTAGDASTANTVYGVKKYVDEVKSLVTASTQFLGVSSTPIVDGKASVATIEGTKVTPGKGDIVMYGTKEFIWDGAKWALLGDTTAEMEAISELQTAVTITLPNAIKNEGDAAKDYTDERIGNLGKVGEADQTVKGYVDAEITKVVGENGSLSNAIDTANEYTDTLIGGALGGEGTTKTVKGYVDAAVKAVEDATDLRLDALEAIDHDHTNKTVLDGITANKVAAWDAAESNAKSAVIGTTGDAATANTVYGAKKYADGKAKEWSDTVLGTAGDAATANTVYGAKKYAEEKAAAAESNAKSAVIGTTGDAATANTVYGAKKYAEEKAAAAKSAVIGTTGDASTANTVYGAKKYAKDEILALDATITSTDKIANLQVQVKQEDGKVTEVNIIGDELVIDCGRYD